MPYHRLPSLLIAAAALAATTAGSADAAIVIAAEDFAGVSKTTTSPVATIDGWDTLNGVAFSGLTFTITEGVDQQSGDGEYEDAHSAALDVDYKVWDAGDSWTIETDTFTLDGSTQSISLNSFDFDSFATNDGGAFRGNTNTDLQWTLTITGDLGYNESDTATTSYSQGRSFVTTSDSIDLSGWADLVSGETYTISIESRGTAGGDSTYSALDSISLSGTITPIPEPGSLALLGLGGLLIAGRGRPRH